MLAQIGSGVLRLHTQEHGSGLFGQIPTIGALPLTPGRPIHFGEQDAIGSASLNVDRTHDLIAMVDREATELHGDRVNSPGADFLAGSGNAQSHRGGRRTASLSQVLGSDATTNFCPLVQQGAIRNLARDPVTQGARSNRAKQGSFMVGAQGDLFYQVNFGN